MSNTLHSVFIDKYLISFLISDLGAVRKSCVPVASNNLEKFLIFNGIHFLSGLADKCN
jgi:hypothetical protein